MVSMTEACLEKPMFCPIDLGANIEAVREKPVAEVVDGSAGVALLGLDDFESIVSTLLEGVSVVWTG